MRIKDNCTWFRTMPRRGTWPQQCVPVFIRIQPNRNPWTVVINRTKPSATYCAYGTTIAVSAIKAGGGFAINKGSCIISNISRVNREREREREREKEHDRFTSIYVPLAVSDVISYTRRVHCEWKMLSENSNAITTKWHSMLVVKRRFCWPNKKPKSYIVNSSSLVRFRKPIEG